MTIHRIPEPLLQQFDAIGQRLTCQSPGCPHTAWWATERPEGTHGQYEIAKITMYCDGHKYLAGQEDA